jgi:hypothetical protein
MADIFYAKLRDSGFSEDAAVRFTGACIRTASANGWAQKTNLCQNSVKNHSNLQKVWKSMLFKAGKDAPPALATWQKRGFSVPVAEFWRLWQEINARNVSKQSAELSVSA